MKVVAINSSNTGSTGSIMMGIAKIARERGHLYYTACPKGRTMSKEQDPYHLFIGSILGRNLHILLGMLSGCPGFFSVIETLAFLRKLKKIQPDIIHLHNLHDCYINLPLLFRFIKKNDIKVVWTLHDCWAFTGRCPHFVGQNCSKWETGCRDCPYPIHEYPSRAYDNSRSMWRKKKELFSGIHEATIVAPSKWLAGFVKRSFLGTYEVRVIYNGIDLSVFKPVDCGFREKHGIESDRPVLLGVASTWNDKKGLDVFVRLAQCLDDRYVIVIVGTNEALDRYLPERILSIHRTENKQQLAGIYTAADVFINPTREETLGLVNIEANACGTPVVTFRTGGSPECIDDESGVVVDCDDIDAMREAIVDICKNHPFSEAGCRKKAADFDRIERYREYVKLYEGMLTK